MAPGEPTPTPSRDMEAYFSGKTIKVVVGFAPGGGYDVFGRLFAKYAPKHFPGSPRFVVQNVDGAGGERVFKTIDGKTDGLSVAVAHPRFFKRELLGADVPLPGSRNDQLSWYPERGLDHFRVLRIQGFRYFMARRPG